MTYDNFILPRIRICITKDNNKKSHKREKTEQDNGNKGVILKDSNWVSRLIGGEHTQARGTRNEGESLVQRD